MKDGLNPQKIKETVRERYGKLIKTGTGSCCDAKTSCCTPNAKLKGTLIKSAGYSDAEIETLPEDVVENAYGCGNPLAFAGIKEGQTIVDIGSGAGIDCFLAAKIVGESGKVIGIDMTPEMIDRARQNAKKAGLKNVEFRLGEAEAMPVEDGSADWIISNCVINLSPDKPKVFAQIARILGPGGRFSISDIVLGEDLPEPIARNMHAWTDCIAGAITESDYLSGLEHAGLSDVKVVSRTVYDDTVIRGFLSKYGSAGKEEMETLVKGISGKIWSAKIQGRKK